MQTAALACPWQAFFPNLKSLLWDDALHIKNCDYDKCIPIFYHAGLQKLSCNVPLELATQWIHLFGGLHDRVSTLKFLGICASQGKRCLLPTTIFASLARLPKLQELHIVGYTLDWTLASDADPLLEVGASVPLPSLASIFRNKLTRLSWTINHRDFIDFVQNVHGVSALQSLTVQFAASGRNCTADELHICFSHVARAFPKMEQLDMDTFDLTENPLSQYFDTDRHLSIITLEPLLGLELKSFTFKHVLRLSLTTDDIQRLSISWPTIVDLNLNRSPLTVASNIGVVPDALRHFASNCPMLINLGLFISWSSPYDDDMVSASRRLLRLKGLKYLNLGVSRCPRDDERKRLVAFLGIILHPACHIPNHDSDFRSGFVESSQMLQSQRDVWDEAQKGWTDVTSALDANMPQRKLFWRQMDLLEGSIPPKIISQRFPS